jgi:hypothetical protein
MFSSIIFFSTVVLGLGYSLIEVLKIKKQNNLERGFLYLAAGLGALPILIIFLNLIRIPLRWEIFLFIGLVVPIINLISRKKTKKLFSYSLEKNKYFWAIIILTIFMFSMYVYGSFIYPYLEDYDPYVHAVGVEYVSQNHTFSLSFDPTTFRRTYLEPYPPAYDALLGVAHQLNNSMTWTLKFFNSLIITLTVPLFYLFSLSIFKKKKKAVAGTAIIFAMPFMGHFIWAQSLVIPLFFCCFYFLMSAKENKNFLYLSIVSLASIYVTQPSAAFIFTIMLLLYWTVSLFYRQNTSFLKKGDNDLIITGLGGGLLALAFYWLPIYFKYGYIYLFKGIGMFHGLFAVNAETLLTDASSGDKYDLLDYFFSVSQMGILQAPGWGPVVFLLVVVFIVITSIRPKKLNKNYLLIVMLVWLIFGILGTLGNSLPIRLFPNRFWVFLAIPTAILATEGLFLLLGCLKNKKDLKFHLVTFVALGVFCTSFLPFLNVQTLWWPGGIIWDDWKDLRSHLWIKDNIPQDSRVFNVCSTQRKVVAYNMESEVLNNEIITFQQEMQSKEKKVVVGELRFLIDKYKYDYILLDKTAQHRENGVFVPNKMINYCTNPDTMVYNDIYESIIHNEAFSLERNFNDRIYLFKYVGQEK